MTTQTCTLVPPLRPGVRAHTKAAYPFLLPRGLAEGALVTVERIEEGNCIVKDRGGKTWTVAAVSLDPGQLVWQDGQWVPERRVRRRG